MGAVGARSYVDSQESFQDICRRDLLEDGKLVLTDSGYELTELGKQAVLKELRQRYEFRPAMLTMIEIYILTRHQCPVW